MQKHPRTERTRSSHKRRIAEKFRVLATACAFLLIMGASARAVWNQASLGAATVNNRDDGKIAFSGPGAPGGFGDIYTMNADGSARTRLTASMDTKGSPALSPDGTKIAFTLEPSSGTDRDIYIYSINADGTNSTRLAFGADIDTNAQAKRIDAAPAWSPDGSKIVFHSNRDRNNEIYVMNADGTNQQRLTEASSNESEPTWSPDGSKIAFVSNRTGTSHIYVMDADGTDQLPLTSGASTDTAPAWSPDGTKIAYQSNFEVGLGIYVMDADGTDPVQLTTFPYHSSPAWSPDGSKIACTLSDSFPPSSSSAIMTMNADGTGKTQISFGAGANREPSWSIGHVPELPSLTIEDTTVVEGDAGSTSARFTVSLSPAGSQTATVDYATSLGSSADYTTTNGTLTFTPGQTTQVISVPIVGDTIPEGTDSFTMTLSGATGASIIKISARATIVNDDQPVCSPPTEGMVAWWDANGNALEKVNNLNGTPYNGATTTAIGNIGQAFSFDGNDDGISVPDADPLKLTDSLTIQAWVKMTDYGVRSVILTRSDNRHGWDPYRLSVDGAGRVQFLIGSLTEAFETQTTNSIPLNQWTHVAAMLDGASGAVTIFINANLGKSTTTTVRPFRDLDPAQSPGITIGNNGADSGTTNSYPFAGLIDELTVHSRALTASEINMAYHSAVNGACSDSTPSISISDNSLVEGNTGPISANFLVTLSSVSSQTVTVNFATANGTATSGSDYTAANGTLTFAPGQRFKTVAIPVLGDTIPESDETFTLTFTNPTNATPATVTAVSTIVNDDSASCTPSTTGLVAWWRSEGTPFDSVNRIDGTLYNGAIATGVGKVGQAFSFDGVNDRIGVPDADALKLTGSLSIQTWVKMTAYGSRSMIFFRGDNRNGLDPYVLSIDSAGRVTFHLESLTEISDLQTTNVVQLNRWVHLTATLDGALGLTKIYINGTVAAEGSTTVRPFQDLDPTKSPGIGIGNTGGYPNTSHNFPFAGLIDELSIYNRALSAAEISSIYASGTNGSCAIEPPSVSINDVSVSEGASGTTNATFNVTLSAPSVQTITVNYATADNTATVGSDYTTANGTLTFAPGETSKTIAVSILGDTAVETTETFFVNLNSATNATVNDGQGIGTIVNDDYGARGGKIAFSSYRDDNYDIYVMNADGSNPTRLTTGREVDWGPRWSRDGSKIAYVSSLSLNVDIFTMNADGSNKTRLTTDAADDRSPSWSPDGSKIVFSSRRDGIEQIYVMNADGSNQTRLMTTTTREHSPDWSPDGTKIAFTSSRSGSNDDIYVVNADGSNPLRLTTNTDVDGLPIWNTSGSRIAFNSRRGSFTYDIYVMNADGTGQTRLTTHAKQDTGNTWSPDDTRIAFESDRDDTTTEDETNYSIYTMNADGASPTRLTFSTPPLGTDNAPSWTAGDVPLVSNLAVADTTLNEGNSGSTLASFTITLSPASSQTVTVSYTTNNSWLTTKALAGSDYTAVSGTLTFAPGETSKVVAVPVLGDTTIEGNEVFLLDLSGAQNATITNSMGIGTIVNDDYGVRGGKIAFESVRDDNYDIYVMNGDGSNPTRLTTNREAESSPEWSPDGTKIAYITAFISSSAPHTEPNTEIYVMNADGTNQVRLTNGPGADTNPTWSPDGAKIAFTSNRDGNAEIYVMDANGSNPTRLTNNSASDSYPDWNPDGSKIAFTSSRSGTGEIYVMNADGSNPTRLTNNTLTESYLDWSPDGARIAFSTFGNGPNNNGIYVMNADGTGIARLTTQFANERNPDWNTDGTKLAFESDQYNDTGITGFGFEIHTMNSDSTDPKRVTSRTTQYETNTSPSWTAGDVPLVSNLAVADTTLNEGNSGSTPASFTITLSPASSQTVTVNYTTNNSWLTTKALAGSDYTAVSGTLTFAPGETSKVVSVPVLGDTTIEGNEVFLLDLSSAQNATITNSMGIGTIVNDDYPLPSISFASPTNGKFVNNLDSITGKVTDNSGTGINRVELIIKRNSDTKYWTGTTWGSRTTLSTTVTGATWKRDIELPTGTNLTEGDYTLAATAFDNAGGSKSTSILFTVDKTVPTILTIAAPVNGSTITALPAINGTVADNAGGTGIGRMDVVLKRLSDNLYWTGTAWAARKLLTINISGTNWNTTTALPTAGKLLPGKYLVAATAYDRAGNGIVANSNFTVASSTPPAVSNTKPGSGRAVSTLDLLEGNVTDKSGTGINRVEVILKRNSDSLYWTGSAWGARTMLTTTVTGNVWRRTQGLPTGALLIEGQYTLAVSAFDNAGGSKSISFYFTVDKTFPTQLTIASPVNGSSLISLSVINGTVQDNVGGTGIGRLDVVLKRLSDGKYWRGNFWGERKLLGIVISGNNWNCTTSLPDSGTLLPGSYLVAAYAFDRTGNSIGANSNFTVPVATTQGASAPQPARSPVVLSMAIAVKNSIHLTFTGVLDPLTAIDHARYNATINGQMAEIENMSLTGSTTVVLNLPKGSINLGDKVMVDYDLNDRKGRKLQGRATVALR
jgi:Tol biopolymer transport system component